MNMERLRTVRLDLGRRAEFLGQPVKFNMLEWLIPGECGTAACVAGYCSMRAMEDIPNEFRERKSTPWFNDIYRVACWYLEVDLDDDRARTLFTPDFLRSPDFNDDNCLRSVRDFVRQCAMKTIDRLVETGVCDWREIYEHYPNWKILMEQDA